MSKPKVIPLYDGRAECLSEEPEFNAAPGVQIEAFLYTSKDIRKLRHWLERAEKWLEKKENK